MFIVESRKAIIRLHLYELDEMTMNREG